MELVPDKLVSIEIIDEETEFFDVSVADNENLFAEGILVHNSRYILVDKILGPVVHKTDVKTMRPRIQVMSTGVEFSIGRSGSQAAFTHLVTRMEGHRQRREMLVRKAVEMAKEGHFVMLPVSRVKSVLKYVQEINQEAEEDWARPFYGGMKKELRKKVIDDARNFRFRVLVGNVSLISTGLNIPRASCLIYCCFSNNLPKAKQRFSRVLTPHEKKPDPVIVLVMDDGDIMTKTRRNEFWNCLYRDFNPIIDNLTFQRLKAHFSTGRDPTISRNDL